MDSESSDAGRQPAPRTAHRIHTRPEHRWDTRYGDEVEQMVAEDHHSVYLTPREMEVAALIGEGLTSKEIGLRLVIAERTVDSHAEHIREKLGLHSRAQIAVWAVDRGLVERPPG